MTYEIAPFDAAYFRALGLLDSGLERFGRLYLRNGLGFVGLVDGRPIAALGICRMWRGVGEAWGFILPDATNYPLFLHRSVRQYLHAMIDIMQLHRVQCTVREQDTRACRWIERLQFRREGRLLAFSPTGESYMLYSLTRAPR